MELRDLLIIAGQQTSEIPPVIDQDHSPPITAGARIETTTSSGNARDTFRMSSSFSRSGAYCRCGVCSGSNSCSRVIARCTSAA